jgi:glucose/arabinose dehydrogenase
MLLTSRRAPLPRFPRNLPLFFVGALAASGVAGCKHKSRHEATTGQASRGEAIFRTRCAVCHSTGEASAQGPGLAHVVGRRAASARGFGYSPAMRASALTWDARTLDRFLASPAQVVPATTMPIRVPSASDRRELIAFLSTLHGSEAPTRSAAPARPSPGDFQADAPGVRRHLRLADLPPPFATESARNAPEVVARPDGALPHVPAGFTVDLFASDLTNPRAIRVAPNGDVFVAESAAGQIRVLRAKDGAKTADTIEVFATGLDRPFGLAFYPPGPSPRWVYVANTSSVVRFPYRAGDLHAVGPAAVVVPALGGTGGHWTRDVAFSPDGARMFVSVGSGSNVAETMPRRGPEEIRVWEQSHAVGSAWGDEEGRADVLVFSPEGKNPQIFATGIRNCVGLAVCPETGDLWCSTNERDGLGDDLVPDYVTRVRSGAFYGWPWLYLGDHEDPRHAGERPDLRAKVTVPDVLLQAHSASLEATFYEGGMFPAEYRGNLFAAFHGSWNRATRTGPKVARVLVHNGVPTGEYEDFMTGFVVDDANVWGRPVGVAVAHDGALLVSEDGNGTVWRVSR